MSGIRSMLKEAQEAIDSGNRVRAKQVLKDLLTLDPNNADAWYLASLVSKDEEAAIYALKRVLKVNPKHAKAFSALTRRLTQQPEQHSIPPLEGDIRLKTTTPTLDQRVPSSVSNADLRETSVAISSSNRPNKKVIRRFGLTATILIFIVIMSIFYHAYTTVLLPTQTPIAVSVKDELLSSE